MCSNLRTIYMHIIAVSLIMKLTNIYLSLSLILMFKYGLNANKQLKKTHYNITLLYWRLNINMRVRNKCILLDFYYCIGTFKMY